jgi:hypothetical protein
MLEQFSVALVQAVTTVLFASHLHICRINSISSSNFYSVGDADFFFFYSSSYIVCWYANAIGQAYSQQYDDVDGHRMYANNLWKNGEVCTFQRWIGRGKKEKKKTEIRAWSQFLSRRSLDEGCYYYYWLINRPNRQPIKRGTRSRKPKRNAAAGNKKEMNCPAFVNPFVVVIALHCSVFCCTRFIWFSFRLGLRWNICYSKRISERGNSCHYLGGKIWCPHKTQTAPYGSGRFYRLEPAGSSFTFWGGKKREWEEDEVDVLNKFVFSFL